MNSIHLFNTIGMESNIDGYSAEFSFVDGYQINLKKKEKKMGRYTNEIWLYLKQYMLSIQAVVAR